MSKVITCEGCSNPITGPSVVDNGKIYHQSCLLRAKQNAQLKNDEARFPNVSRDILRALREEEGQSSIDALGRNYCTISYTDDSEISAKGFDTETETKAYMAEERDGSWCIEHLFIKGVPTNFEIQKVVVFSPKKK